MRQVHGVPGEKRPLAVTAHEVDRELGEHILAELARPLAAAAVLQDVGIPVAALGRRIAFLGPRPDAMLVEAVPRESLRLLVEIVDLPLAGDGRGVARLLEDPRQREVAVPIEAASAIDRGIVMPDPARAARITPAEQHGPRRAAQRRGIAGREARAGGGQARRCAAS